MFPSWRRLKFESVVAAALWTLLLALGTSPARAQDRPPDVSVNDHQATPLMSGEHAEIDAQYQRKLLVDKKESEFNHHLSGVLLVVSGLVILAEGILRHRWSFLRFAWPFCFLFSGLFLLVFSDTELWPFGPQSWWYGLTHNLEDLQHKAFAVILLALGVLELQRVRGVLKSAWAGWVFPVLAFCGSVMLLFHEHHTGMHGSGHMAVMARIQSEHFNFALTGFGVGVLKGLSEFRSRWQAVLARLWSLPVITLGVLLMFYAE